MPSSKKKNNNKKNKLLKGGKSCPPGSRKVCITTGKLDKLLKQVAVKKITKKLRKANPNKRTKQGTAKAVPEKKKSFLGSMFGSDEEALPKVEEETPKLVEEKSIEETPKLVEEKSIEEKSIEEKSIEETPKLVEEKSIEEKSIEEKSIEETPKLVEEIETESNEEPVTQNLKKEEQKSFIGSIFGTEEKKPAVPAK